MRRPTALRACLGVALFCQGGRIANAQAVGIDFSGRVPGAPRGPKPSSSTPRRFRGPASRRRTVPCALPCFTSTRHPARRTCCFGYCLTIHHPATGIRAARATSSCGARSGCGTQEWPTARRWASVGSVSCRSGWVTRSARVRPRCSYSARSMVASISTPWMTHSGTVTFLLFPIQHANS